MQKSSKLVLLDKSLRNYIGKHQHKKNYSVHVLMKHNQVNQFYKNMVDHGQSEQKARQRKQNKLPIRNEINLKTLPTKLVISTPLLKENVFIHKKHHSINTDNIKEIEDKSIQQYKPTNDYLLRRKLTYTTVSDKPINNTGQNKTPKDLVTINTHNVEMEQVISVKKKILKTMKDKSRKYQHSYEMNLEQWEMNLDLYKSLYTQLMLKKFSFKKKPLKIIF